jgi:hypothetical protein
MFSQGRTVNKDDWTHRTVGRPSFLIYVISGSAPADWLDYCPECAPKYNAEGWTAPPTHWKLSRWAFLLAAIFGSLAVYAHLFVDGAR